MVYSAHYAGASEAGTQPAVQAAMIVAERRARLAAVDSESPTPSPRPHLLAIVLLGAAACMLLLLSLDRVVRGLVVMPQQVEAMYGESIIYDQAARLLRGEALYQPLDRPPFAIAAYTPVYYSLVAGLRIVAGPGFWPGRILSFVAGMTAAAIVGYLATRRTGERRAGLFAAGLFLGLGFPGDYPWFGFYKEDMLGVALSLGAVAALDRGGARRPFNLVAGCLAGAAILVKQTFFVASLVGVAWLWRTRRSAALTFAATAFAVPGIVCALLTVTNGAFLDNTVRANLNPNDANILRANLEVLVRYQGVPVAIALLGLLGGGVHLRRWVDDPLVAFWFVSALLLPLTLAKVGSNWNYWIIFAALNAPLATWSVWAVLMRGDRISGPAWLSVATGALLLVLLASPAWLPHPTLDLPTIVSRALQPDQQQAEEFAGVLERVRSEPRDVLAEPLDIVVLADRNIAFEPYIFSILSTQGQWDPGVLVRQICSGQIGLLVLDHPLDGPDWQTQGYRHWPPVVLDILRATMRFDSTQARLFLYIPALEPANGERVSDLPPPCPNP